MTQDLETITSKRQFTILVAEDEMINFTYIKSILQIETEDEFNIIHALNGQEAVDACRSNESIELVLMDIKMPIMDGFEATEKIKHDFPSLPVIVQSAYSADADKNLAKKKGCDEYLVKPINKKELIENIYKYLKPS